MSVVDDKVEVTIAVKGEPYCGLIGWSVPDSCYAGYTCYVDYTIVNAGTDIGKVAIEVLADYKTKDNMERVCWHEYTLDVDQQKRGKCSFTMPPWDVNVAVRTYHWSEAEGKWVLDIDTLTGYPKPEYKDVRTVKALAPEKGDIISVDAPPSAIPGSKVTITAIVHNAGVGGGTIWIRAYDKDTGTEYLPRTNIDLAPCNTKDVQIVFTMPKKDVTVVIEVGHYKPGTAYALVDKKLTLGITAVAPPYVPPKIPVKIPLWLLPVVAAAIAAIIAYVVTRR